MIKKYYLVNGLLLILAIVSFFAWYQAKPTDKTTQPAVMVDAFATEVESIQFNELGQKRAEVQTTKLWHFAREDSSLLTKPRLTLYSADRKAPWVVSAKTGKTFNGAQRIDLIDDVVIHQSSSTNNTDTLITTSLLHIFPKKQLATTDQLVTLVQAGVKITSIGMNAYLDQKHVTLLSQTRGFYDPKKALNRSAFF